MKRIISVFLAAALSLLLFGCSRSMNEIIAREPSVTGMVEQIGEESILIRCSHVEGQGKDTAITVPLEGIHEDSIHHFHLGDQVTVYYDGRLMEVYPLRMQKVYAITLLEPASRDENE